MNKRENLIIIDIYVPNSGLLISIKQTVEGMKDQRGSE